MVLHHVVGWATFHVSIQTIVRGLDHARVFEGLRGDEEKYRVAYMVSGISMGVLFAVLLIINIVRWRRGSAARSACAAPTS